MCEQTFIQEKTKRAYIYYIFIYFIYWKATLTFHNIDENIKSYNTV